MMPKKVQAKDIPETPILDGLLAIKKHNPTSWAGAIIWDLPGFDFSLMRKVPAGTPEKVLLAKMASLVKRGLVDGCCCGCRGDFRITDKGIAHLEEKKVKDGD